MPTRFKVRPIHQSRLDTAMARAFLYGFLAQAYTDPVEATWKTLSSSDTRKSLALGLAVLGPSGSELELSGRALHLELRPDSFEPFLSAYLSAFGHAARGRCPLNELEYGDIKADPLFQPHRLADLAAFYRAFGLEVAGEAGERHDHLAVELEFMSVIAAKEAYAWHHQLDSEQLEVCREAQKKFLREHLGRWAVAFARRLKTMAGGSPLAALAQFTQAFIQSDCERFGVVPGSEDLVLRPVDEAAEKLCASCGLGRPPDQHAPADES